MSPVSFYIEMNKVYYFENNKVYKSDLVSSESLVNRTTNFEITHSIYLYLYC